MASEKITALIEEVKALTVLELSELVHALEDEFGVSAAAPVAVAAASRLSVRSPAWAWLTPRLLLRPLPRPSRKAFPRMRPRT